MEIGSRVKNLLRLRGFSQAWLAENLGISAARLNNYLCARSEPTMELLCKMADKLDSSLDFIMGRADEPSKGKSMSKENDNYALASFSDNNQNMKMLVSHVPVYLSLSVDESEPCHAKPCKWAYVSGSSDKLGEMYGLIMQDDSLSPTLIKNDLAIVENCEVVPGVINPNQLYVFKRNEDDSIGRFPRKAFYQNGMLIASPFNSDYIPKIFDLRNLKFNPISGKISTIIRTL